MHLDSRAGLPSRRRSVTVIVVREVYIIQISRRDSQLRHQGKAKELHAANKAECSRCGLSVILPEGGPIPLSIAVVLQPFSSMGVSTEFDAALEFRRPVKMRSRMYCDEISKQRHPTLLLLGFAALAHRLAVAEGARWLRVDHVAATGVYWVVSVRREWHRDCAAT